MGITLLKSSGNHSNLLFISAPRMIIWTINQELKRGISSNLKGHVYILNQLERLKKEVTGSAFDSTFVLLDI